MKSWEKAWDLGIMGEDSNDPCRIFKSEAVVVGQLVERSLPTLEIYSSNPVVGKFYLLSTVKEVGSPINSHVSCSDQSECFISAQQHS